MIRKVAKAVPGVAPAYAAIRSRYRSLEATTHALRFRRRAPQFQMVDNLWMDEPFRYYVTEISVDFMATSLQMSKFLASVMESLQTEDAVGGGRFGMALIP